MGAWGLARPVWHCSMRAAPGDKMLSDDEWAQIACDVMHRTGLAPSGQDDDAVRWVAIRHGDDHIHIVAMLARQDGRRPRAAQRPVPGAGGVPGRRAALRAAADCSWRPHGCVPADPGRIGEGCPAGPGGGAEDHPAAPGQPGGCGSRQRAGVLRPAQPVRRAGPHPAAAPATPASSPGTPSPCPATPPRPGRRSGTGAGNSPPT